MTGSQERCEIVDGDQLDSQGTDVIVVLGIAVLVLLSGCSARKTSRLSPPAWIIGTWSNGMKYTFTPETVVMGDLFDLREMYRTKAELFRTTPNISDNATSTSYTITIVTRDLNLTDVYQFVKLTSNSLNCSESGSSGNMTYILYRE